jgi:two-component sensor histidine kinase
LTINIDGQVVCRSGSPIALPSPPNPWLEQVRGGKTEAIGAFGKSHRFAIAVAAKGDVLTAVLPETWLGSRVFQEDYGDREAVWLLDQEHAVLASRGAAAAALPTLPTMFDLIASSQIALRATSAIGAPYAYASTLLPGGWRLIAATSSDHEHAIAIRALLVRLAELTVLLVAGLSAVVIGADVAFGQPLRRLSAAVQRWRSGAAFDPGDLTGAPDEVLQLADSFRDATKGLRQREQELVHAQQRQDLLVLEIHHRVKNNLQVIASLLNLQASRIRAPEAKAEFQAARDRVRALATLHRHLYADGDLHTINMRSFLVELCGQLFQAMGEKEGARIQLVIEAPELRMSSDQAVPLALIVTEAVTNSVRYAFPGGRQGHISVILKDHEGGLDLTISDDGVGVLAGRAETESGERDGIGLQLIRGFTRQLGASLTVEEGHGTQYGVRLTRDVQRRESAPDVAPLGQDTAA